VGALSCGCGRVGVWRPEALATVRARTTTKPAGIKLCDGREGQGADGSSDRPHTAPSAHNPAMGRWGGMLDVNIQGAEVVAHLRTGSKPVKDTPQCRDRGKVSPTTSRSPLTYAPLWTRKKKPFSRVTAPGVRGVSEGTGDSVAITRFAWSRYFCPREHGQSSLGSVGGIRGSDPDGHGAAVPVQSEFELNHAVLPR
jgi:hypothetical protein